MPPNLDATLFNLGSELELIPYAATGRGVAEPIPAGLAERHHRSIDVSPLADDEIEQRLAGLPFADDKAVVICWPADRCAARGFYRSLVRNYDDLWYPSQDDVLVVQSEPGVLRRLTMSHEEYFTYIEVEMPADIS
ncbi:hypothetical protein J5X84_07400 [Streptosporangiaceae bacterium NEAU-GS5]|nr:hypothetical protein [Streptosporangiaceae bacterium NEAU-GS5]